MTLCFAVTRADHACRYIAARAALLRKRLQAFSQMLQGPCDCGFHTRFSDRQELPFLCYA